MDVDDEIRLELRVEPPRRAKPFALGIALAAITGVGLHQAPLACLLGGVLPLAFTWIAYSIVARRDRGFTLRARAGALEVDHAEVVERLEWQLVTEVRDTSEGLVIPLTHGRLLRIPSALVPDRRTLMDAMPSHVKLTVERPQQGSDDTWKTIAIWVALVLAIYLFAQLGWIG